MKKGGALSSEAISSKVRECQSHLLEQAMSPVQASLRTVPSPCHLYRGNAPLNLALGFLIEQHGQLGTAQLLSRLNDSLAQNQFPSQAMDPFRLDG